MDEKRRILKMIENGTITADEAAILMDALDEESKTCVVDTDSYIPYDRYMFRIIVNSPQGDKINVNMPVGAVRRLLKAAGKFPIPEDKIRGIEFSEMMEAVEQCLRDEIIGDIVSVDAADGTAVRIFVDREIG